MNCRRGFVLDAQTMDLNSAKPCKGTPKKTKTTDKCTISSIFPEQNEMHMGKESTKSGCSPDCINATKNNNHPPKIIQTEHYRCRLHDICECSRRGSGESHLVNMELNTIFLKRLQEIDCLDKETKGKALTTQLRLVTFQEWADMLLQVNNIIMSDMCELKRAAYDKILAWVQSVHSDKSQLLEENRKLRNDMCAIIRFAQKAYHQGDWGTDGLCLKTLTIDQLLGVQQRAVNRVDNGCGDSIEMIQKPY